MHSLDYRRYCCIIYKALFDKVGIVVNWIYATGSWWLLLVPDWLEPEVGCVDNVVRYKGRMERKSLVLLVLVILTTEWLCSVICIVNLP